MSAAARKVSKKAEITVRGKVQGVFYRYWTYAQMRELGLDGKVENQGGDRVFIEVEGSKESIDELARCCHDGPPLAEVAEVQVKWTSS